MISLIAEKLAALKAKQTFLKEFEKEPIPLSTVLTLFERSSWETMQANNWAGFKALVKTFGPVEIPSYPKQNFPFIFCNWEISKIAELVGTSVHEVGLTFLYLKYPSLANEVIKEAEGGIDKQSDI